jgi:acetyltransferase
MAIDINPLFADEKGVLVVDAEIRVDAQARSDLQRLSIQPYPKELEEEAQLRDGRPVLLRPIRPEDEAAQQVLMSHMSPQDIRFRFFRAVSNFPHLEMARFTQIDYDREMAFIATVAGLDGVPETLGVVGTVTDERRQLFGRVLHPRPLRFQRRGAGQSLDAQDDPLLPRTRHYGNGWSGAHG